MPVPIPGPHSDVLPPVDADYGLFITQFSAAWVPATFNTVLPTVISLTTASTDFNSALAAASDPTTRTAVTIASKDLVRATSSILLRSAIRAAQAAYLAGLVTEAQINNLGVRANQLIRTPIGEPIYAPILGFDGSFPGVNRLRVTQVDQVTGLALTTRGFLYGIVGVLLERRIAAGPFSLRFSVQRVRLFDSTIGLTPGDLCGYRVRYVTARGLVSPFSPIVSGFAQ